MQTTMTTQINLSKWKFKIDIVNPREPLQIFGGPLGPLDAGIDKSDMGQQTENRASKSKAISKTIGGKRKNKWGEN